LIGESDNEKVKDEERKRDERGKGTARERMRYFTLQCN
jgi:hypothetical protein